MLQALCPVLIGRDADGARLRQVVDGLSHGRGGTVVVTGEAGIGKSRLVRDAAAAALERGAMVLTGRAVPGPAPVAYRPLSEALLGGLRAAGPAVSDQLRTQSPALARVLPGWADAAGSADDGGVLVGDGVLRALRALGGPGGCVLVLEDLHWADPETLAVVEYLADNVASEPVAVLATSRVEEGGLGVEMLDRLVARRAGAVVELHRLAPNDVSAMVAACVGAVPDELQALVAGFGDGIPFLVEELVAAWADRLSAGLTEIPVPRTLAATVRERLDRLNTDERRVIQAAAVLGRDVEWQLLDAVAGVSDQVVATALEKGLACRLLGADGLEVRFRHALTREAVLATVLPPARVGLAGRALEAIEAAHPGLAGERCDSAARLALEAGRTDRAAELLLEAGRRALRQAALTSAEAALRAAHDVSGGDEVDELLVETLALAGRYDEAASVGGALLRRLALVGGDPDRRLAVQLRLARAAVAGQRWASAAEHLDAARSLGTTGAGLLAQIDALSAHLAMGEGRLDDARLLAERAVDQALSDGAVEVACEALEVVGRAARVTDLDLAEQAFARARRLADDHGLGVWSLRALHELGTIDLFRAGDLDRLMQARLLAVDAGALVTVAIIDLQLSAGYSMACDIEPGLACARRCQEACRRFHLVVPLALAIQFEASFHALGGHWAAMQRAADDAMAVAAEVPEVVAAVWGDTLAVASLIREDRPEARERLEKAAAIRRQAVAPGPSPSAGLWALIRAVDGADAAAAVAEVWRSGATVNRMNGGLCRLAEAVLAGRAQRPQVASDLFDEGSAHLSVAPWWRHLGRRLVAEAAVSDGWGQPAEWLAEAAPFFAAAGHDRLALASRSLLRRAGGQLPRAYTEVPAHLRRFGITPREAEVLSLLAEGESTSGIAGRLYLSPRTVEKHVESLQRKTDQHTRARLIAFASRDLHV